MNTEPKDNNSTTKSYSIREFAELKGMPSKAEEHFIRESLFGEEMSVPGMFFGEQFVCFSHQVAKEHKGQTPYQIAADILRNASEYEIKSTSSLTTKEGASVFSVHHVTSKDNQHTSNQTNIEKYSAVNEDHETNQQGAGKEKLIIVVFFVVSALIAAASMGGEKFFMYVGVAVITVGLPLLLIYLKYK